MDGVTGGFILLAVIGVVVFVIRIFVSKIAAIGILELWAAYHAYEVGAGESSFLLGIFFFVCFQAFVGLFYFVSMVVEDEFFK